MIALHRAPRRDSLAFVLVVFGSVFASTVPVEAVEAELLELPERLAERDLAALQTAIEQIHARAARSREAWTEADLQKKVPERFLALDAKLAKVKDPKARAKAMVELALLWAELAWVERIDPLVEAIAKDDADLAARLGSFAASENVFARVVGADPKYARAAVDLVEAAHEGYRKLFGFEHVSKLPGKKIRVLIQVDPEIERTRLYFHPSPKWHS
ncbi:MAG TPA: hypothetical protein VK116_05415, partial [Planctomycetota bacterium]|nr:hypothetical protein [Planctomycetota bacterium]